MLPSEIIIVDGGSADGTPAIIKNFFKDLEKTPGFKPVTVFEEVNGNSFPPGYEEVNGSDKKSGNINYPHARLVFESIINGVISVKIYNAPGANISRGRNIAIKNAKSEFVCVSDAGCRLSRNWLEEISKYFTCNPAKNAAANTDNAHNPDNAANTDCADNADNIVAGGYNFPYIENFLQACLAVCVLPVKSEISLAKYMPSSRNISFAKAAWEKAGGYPQNMDFGEDMRFNFNLKAAGYKIKFNPDALVYWNLRNSAVSIFRQFFRYAKGDAVGRMYLHRHLIRFAAIILFAAFIMASIFISPYFLLAILLLFAAFIYRPYLRIKYFLNDKNCCVFTENKKTLFFIKLKTIFAIPLMLSCIETAKLAGFIYGLFIRKNF